MLRPETLTVHQTVSPTALSAASLAQVCVRGRDGSTVCRSWVRVFETEEWGVCSVFLRCQRREFPEGCQRTRPKAPPGQLNALYCRWIGRGIAVAGALPLRPTKLPRRAGETFFSSRPLTGRTTTGTTNSGYRLPIQKRPTTLQTPTISHGTRPKSSFPPQKPK